MKPFDLEKAKNGEKTCLVDGRKAEILDFNFNGNLLVKIYDNNGNQFTREYNNYGKVVFTAGMTAIEERDQQLAMFPKIAYMKVLKNNSTGLLEGDIIDYDLTRVKHDAGLPMFKEFFCYAKVEFIEEGGQE